MASPTASQRGYHTDHEVYFARLRSLLLKHIRSSGFLTHSESSPVPPRFNDFHQDNHQLNQPYFAHKFEIMDGYTILCTITSFKHLFVKTYTSTQKLSTQNRKSVVVRIFVADEAGQPLGIRIPGKTIHDLDEAQAIIRIHWTSMNVGMSVEEVRNLVREVAESCYDGKYERISA